MLRRGSLHKEMPEITEIVQILCTLTSAPHNINLLQVSKLSKKIKKLGLTKLFPEAVLYNTLEYPARHQDINGRYVLKECSQRNKVHKSSTSTK